MSGKGPVEEMSYHEYLISATLNEMGISCPRVFDFVTDSTRFGMTVERMQGKKSYVRMIADILVRKFN